VNGAGGINAGFPPESGVLFSMGNEFRTTWGVLLLHTSYSKPSVSFLMDDSTDVIELL